MQRPTPKQQQSACDRFNAVRQVGDQITVYRGLRGDDPEVVTVTYPAQLLSGHTAVVYVSGGKGCVALSHVAKEGAWRG